MTPTATFFDLRAALAQPGCALCRLKTTAARRYIDTLLWELVNDIGVREHIRHARGFCSAHSDMVRRFHASLEMAIILRDVLGDLLGQLDRECRPPAPPRPFRRIRQVLLLDEGPANAAAALADRMAPAAPCPICIQADATEASYLQELVTNLVGDGSEPALLGAYQASAGLCLPHFLRALSHVPDDATYDALVQVQREVWGKLVGELEEIIRKNDYRFCDEPWGSESDAWLRALDATSGSSVAGRISAEQPGQRHT